jgi:hypothetical protein
MRTGQQTNVELPREVHDTQSGQGDRAVAAGEMVRNLPLRLRRSDPLATAGGIDRPINAGS